MSEHTAEDDAGCVECGGDIDRTIPNPIPEGYGCMWSEAMTGRALYCLACYSDTPPADRHDRGCAAGVAPSARCTCPIPPGSGDKS